MPLIHLLFHRTLVLIDLYSYKTQIALMKTCMCQPSQCQSKPVMIFCFTTLIQKILIGRAFLTYILVTSLELELEFPLLVFFCWNNYKYYYYYYYKLIYRLQLLKKYMFLIFAIEEREINLMVLFISKLSKDWHCTVST